jgi:hypothetical protein
MTLTPYARIRAARRAAADAHDAAQEASTDAFRASIVAVAHATHARATYDAAGALLDAARAAYNNASKGLEA